MIGKSDQIDVVFATSDECDLSRGTISEALTSSDMDPNTETFHATVDRVLFKKPVEMVMTVLEANGYTPNLENILSCLDQLIVGVKSRISSRQIATDAKQIRLYMPCLTFKMPIKGRIGPLLRKFYSEIEAYEAEVERLQGGGSAKKIVDKEQSKAELRDEIKVLHAENRELRSLLDVAAKNLTESRQSFAQAERAMASGNYLPTDIRPATVKEILLNERVVALRTGRKVFHISMSTLTTVPPVGEACLVHIKGGVSGQAFFFESPGSPFRKELATVLNAENGVIKIRVHSRQRLVLDPKNEVERAAFLGLRRGDKIVLKIFEQHVVGFESCATGMDGMICDKVQDQIATRQIGVMLTKVIAEQREDEILKQGEAS